MDIDGIIQNITIYVQDNIIVSVVIGLFIIFLLFRHPNKLLLVIILLAIAYGLARLFDYLRIITKW